MSKLTRNLFETLIEAFFDGFLEFFVDCEAHFFKFFRIIVLESFDASIKSTLNIMEVLGNLTAIFAEGGVDVGV